MTTAILAIVTVAALIWMLRVEARLREIFNRLDRQQARTDRMEASAAANGRISAREQARIQHSEDRHSRHIYRQKHDRQMR